MGNSPERIHVSETVKQKLENHRRTGESYNDVLERVLGVDDRNNVDDWENADRDLLAGFGRWSDERADRVRKRSEESRD